MCHNTDRPITSDLDTNVLAVTDPNRIWATAFALLDGSPLEIRAVSKNGMDRLPCASYVLLARRG
jgi:hypothetical protein